MSFGVTNNLLLRVVSAVLLLPPVLASLYFGGWWFMLLIMIAGTLMAIEWSQLAVSRNYIFGVSLALVLMAVLVFMKQSDTPLRPFFMFGFGAVALSAISLWLGLYKKFAWWLMGIGYVGLPLFSLWWIRELDAMLVLWIFLIVWGTDIGGYFAGKSIGGPKLAARISPKKTWAGLLGGMLLSVLASVAMVIVSSWPASLAVVALLSALLAVWAQVGDLFESAVKRHFGVKDSGGLIPGHGGLLDRVDGVVFVAPALVIVAHMCPEFLKAF